MDLPCLLAGGLAVNRIVFGFNHLARPEQAGPSGIGPAAGRPGTLAIIRSHGARDIAARSAQP
jgi:hypothetical protein